jgi:hypothetical protein
MDGDRAVGGTLFGLQALHDMLLGRGRQGKGEEAKSN